MSGTAVNAPPIRTIVFAAASWVPVILGATAFASDSPSAPLRLDAAIVEAVAHNPEMRALSAAVTSASSEVATAGTWTNPELALAPGVRDTDGSGSEFHGVFGLSQLFEFPGKRALRRAVAEKSVEARQIARMGFEHQLSAQVRRVFYSVVLAQEAVKLRQARLDLAQSFLEAAHRKVAGGVAPEFEETKAEVDVLAARRALRTEQARASATSGELNTLLGRAPQAELTVVEDTSGIDVGSLVSQTEFLAHVAARNPSILVQEKEVERAEAGVQVASKSRLPDFAIGPSLEYTKDEQTIDFGITFPLPVLDRKQGVITTAIAEHARALAELEVLRLEVARDAGAAYQRLAAAHENLSQFTPEFLRRLDSAMASAAQGYAEGRVPLLVYLEIQRSCFDARMDHLDTLQDVVDARAAVETAAGLPMIETSTP